VGSGLKQIDPYGHFYIYCPWENARATLDQPALTLIYAGPDGTLQTKCGGVKQKGDDQILTVNVAEAIQRTAVWQANGNNDVRYGATGTQVRVNSDGTVEAIMLTVSITATVDMLHLTNALPLGDGGTGQQSRLNASLSESALNFLKKPGILIINNKLCVQHVEKILFMFYLHSTHCFTMSIKHSPKFFNALSERLGLNGPDQSRRNSRRLQFVHGGKRRGRAGCSQLYDRR